MVMETLGSASNILQCEELSLRERHTSGHHRGLVLSASYLP